MAENATKTESKTETKTETKSEKPAKKPSVLKACIIIFGILFILFIILFIAINFFSSPKPTANTQPPISSQSTSTQTVSKDDLLSYFTTIAFHDSFTGAQKTLIRWDQSTVSVQLLGNYDQNVVSKLDEFIAGFNALSATTKLNRVADGGDLTIDFEPRDVLAPKISDPNLLERSTYAWTNLKPDDNGKITSGKIYIQDDQKNNALSLAFVLGHEMGHAIGFQSHDPVGRGCSLMSNIPCGPMQYFTAYDQFAIKAMYNTDIPTGMGEAAGKNYINAHWPN